MTPPDDTIEAEQSHLDFVHDCLEQATLTADRHLRETLSASGDARTHQARSERDAAASLWEERLDRLKRTAEPVYFGRLDMEDGSTLRIGRLSLFDSSGGVVLTDWRAPAASPFYQATALQPMGVRRRRRLLTRHRQVLDVDDEIFGSTLHTYGGSRCHGTAALIAAVAPRDGRMPDVLATIAADQDRIIRDRLAGTLVIDGAPGTGKTVVALHRAAYLLYTHQRLQRSGVLVVGPNDRFLRYISEVLPALGESAVVLTAPHSLVAGIHADRSEPPTSAAVKGDIRMAGVLTRAVRAHQRIPRSPVTIRTRWSSLTIDRQMVRAARGAARATGLPHNRARAAFVATLADAAAAQAEPTEDLRRSDLLDHREFRIIVDALWPRLTPTELLTSLRTDAVVLAAATDGLLSTSEAQCIAQDEPGWSRTDIALLDEARVLLGPLANNRPSTPAVSSEIDLAAEVTATTGTPGLIDPALLADRYRGEAGGGSVAEQARADDGWAYGHVIVDEAQELSAMEWRAVMRRCPSRSMTIVGDPAQATTPGAAASWQEALSPHLPRGWRTRTLRINYRTTSEIADLAKEVLHAGKVAPPDVESVRSGRPPRAVANASTAGLVKAIQLELDALSDAHPRGRIAVVAVPAQRRDLQARIVVGANASLLTVDEAKGLEFDGVIVVDPDAVIASEHGDWRSLYVAMTRTTHDLVILCRSDSPVASVLGLRPTPCSGPGDCSPLPQV